MDEVTIFVSYSHEDRMWVGKGPRGLVRWLQDSLEAIGVKFLLDRELRKAGGEDYGREIAEAVNVADLAMLLISQSYLNSTFIREVELPLIQQRVEEQRLGMIPILVDYANFKLAPRFGWIADRQMLPGNPEPLVTYVDDLPRWSKVRADILDSMVSRVEAVRARRAAWQ